MSLFYVISKTLWFFAQPSSLIALALVVGLALSRTALHARCGFRLTCTALAFLVLCGIGPFANMAILPLEQRFAGSKAQPLAESVAGIIVLGGYEDGRISERRGSLHFNEAGERLTEAARLAYRLPALPVIISGGSAALLREDLSAAQAIKDYLVAIGIGASRIKLEDKSTTTYANAVLTRDLVKPRRDQRWYLVTSAAHMPRSVGAFRRQGFIVIPWPVDFRTADAGDWRRPFASIPAGLKRLDDATMEWAGLIAYRLTGRSDELFPAP